MMSNLPSHDELMLIARENPERLERIRHYFIEKHIQAAPERMQRRLRGLQFQIDGLRRIHKSPMGSCIEISKLMYESLGKMRDTINGTHVEPEPAELPAAPVLAFPAH